MQFALLDAIRNGRFRQAKLLVEARADLEGRDAATGEVALILCCTHLADAKTRTKFLLLLLDAGADPNVQDNQDMSALMHSAVLGQTDVVLMLLNQPKINLELQDCEGNTALMYASAFGHTDIVTLLLNQMGRLRQVLHLSQENHQGMTALQMAQKNGHRAVACLLGGEQDGSTGTPEKVMEIVKLPRPRRFLAVSKEWFPDPEQLSRNPTPGSPSLTSFPVRWHRRQKQLKLKEGEAEESGGKTPEETEEKKTEEVASEGKVLDDQANPSISKCSLPRLWRNTPVAPFPYSPQPINAANRSRGEDFQKMLNFLDASIHGDGEKQRLSTPHSLPPSTSASHPPTNLWRPTSTKPIHGLATKLHTSSNQRHFPPIRPTHAAHFLPPMNVKPSSIPEIKLFKGTNSSAK